MIANDALGGKQETLIQEISINILPQHKARKRLRKKPVLEVSVLKGAKRKTITVPLSSKKKKVSPSHILRLPFELLNLIFTYFTPAELLATIQSTSKSWHNIIQAPYLWELLNSISPLPLEYKYAVKQKVVERRSKGQLYVAQHRITGARVVLRKVVLEVANSEKDDGVPTSALREVSYLTSLSSPYVGTVTEAQVKGGVLLLVYPYQRYNLKEYMREFVRREGEDEFSVRYCMPLEKIKVTCEWWNIANRKQCTSWCKA